MRCSSNFAPFALQFFIASKITGNTFFEVDSALDFISLPLPNIECYHHPSAQPINQTPVKIPAKIPNDNATIITPFIIACLNSSAA